MSPKVVGRIRWIIAGLLFVETILNYLDLQTLAVLAPTLGKEMGLTDIQYATITQAFQITYLVAFLLGGWVVDKLGVRWGLALGMIWWSLAEAAHGFARTEHELLLFRSVLGLGYPMAYLAAAKAASEWFPPQERGFVTGVYTAGATVGATVAPPLIAWLAIRYNWHAAFFITGFVGVVYALVWLYFYHTPETSSLLAEPERHYILGGRTATNETAPPLGESLPFLLRSRYLWAIVLGRMIGDTPWIFYVYWIPKFLSSAQGLDLRAIGMVAWVPFLFSDIGSLGGGWLSGRLIRRGSEPVQARLKVMLGCACIGCLSFTIYYTHSLALVIGLMSLMMLSTMAWMVNLSTLPIDVFPQEMVGTAVGLTTVGAVIGQTTFSFFIGRIVHAYSYGPLFVIMSFLPPIAYVVVRFILRKIPAASPSE